MTRARRAGRTWLRLALIAAVVLLAAFALLLLTDGGGLFDYDTF